jgi:hypothetical protein
MPDMTLCVRTDCPLASTCLRAKASANPLWQSYAKFEFRVTPNGVECDSYIPTHEERNRE